MHGLIHIALAATPVVLVAVWHFIIDRSLRSDRVAVKARKDARNRVCRCG